MAALTIPGYLKQEDLDIASVALRADLRDIEELEHSTTGDCSAAFRFQRLEIEEALRIIAARQLALQRDLQNLRPGYAPRPILSDPEQLEELTAVLAAASSSSSSSTPDQRISNAPRPGARPTPNRTTFSSGLASSSADVAPRIGSSQSSINTDPLSYHSVPSNVATSTTGNIADELALKFAAIWEDADPEFINTKASERLEDEVLSGSEGVLGLGDEIEANSALHKSEKGKEVARLECVVCQDHVVAHNATKLPCGDQYCAYCLQELFNTSLVDESLFPPRCCRQPIDPEKIEEFLTPAIIAAHFEKKIEFETVDRTYCSDPRCSIFIHAEHISGECATCPECKKVTCTMCKAPSHGGDCPADEATQQLLQMAQENGWQRCTTCKRMISISTGCNHMRFVHTPSRDLILVQT